MIPGFLEMTLAYPEARRILRIVSAIQEPLRRALAAAPSRYSVASATGVSEATLSRFVRGLSDLRLGTADKIAAHLGLRLTSVPSRKAQRRGAR